MPNLRKSAESLLFAALLIVLCGVALMKLVRGCSQFFP